MSEIWRDIEGYERLYQISNLGRVKSLKRNTAHNRIMKPKKDKYGYLYIGLCKNGELSYKKIHRLVARAFIPNYNNLPQINHIDGNKTHNCVSNLEWCDASYNQKHAYRLGLSKSWMKGKFGKDCKFSRKVYQYSLDGHLLKIWNSISDVNRELDIPVPNVVRSCKEDTRTAGGYKWKYVLKEGD